MLIKRNFRGGFVQIALFSLLLLVTLMMQPSLVEFVKGHHGWVSSHGLSIMKKANFDNGFLGYSCYQVDANKNLHLDYFDRYPVFFSAFMNFLLSFVDTMINEIYIARLFMNLVFVASIFLGYKILNILGITDKIASVSASILAFSGVFFIYYKDMIHYDQPAILSMMFMLYAILKYEKKQWLGKRIIIISLITPLVGRGYVINLLLMLWFVLDAFKEVILDKNKFSSIFRGIPFKSFIVGFVASASFLMYNVVREAITRGVSIIETSIFDSARFRLGFSEIPKEDKYYISIYDFFSNQVYRFIQNFVPYSFSGDKFRIGLEHPQIYYWVMRIACLIFLVLIFKAFQSSFFKQNLKIVLLMFSFGFVWLFGMKNLSAYHDYTSMYHILLVLLFWGYIFVSLRKFIKPYFFLIISLIVFITSLYNVRQVHLFNNDNVKVSVNEMQNVIKKIKPDDLIAIDGGRFGEVGSVSDVSPFLFCYYLNDYQFLKSSASESATKIISSNRRSFKCEIATGNEKVFLFDGGCN